MRAAKLFRTGVSPEPFSRPEALQPFSAAAPSASFCASQPPRSSSFSSPLPLGSRALKLKFRRLKGIKAFTLIELLTVVVIMVALLALLLPGLMKARDAAKRIQCVSNLKQLGCAYAMYISDYRRLWSRTPITPCAYMPTGDFRYYYFIDKNYTGVKFGINNQWLGGRKPCSIYYCPVNTPTSDLSNYLGNSVVLGNNEDASFYNGFIERVQAPSLVTYLAEGKYYLNPSISLGEYNRFYLTSLGTPHNLGQNLLFVDGHVWWLAGPMKSKYCGRADKPPSQW